MAEKNLKISGKLKALSTSGIRWIERVGNYLPHPFFLFILLIFVIFLLSFILNQLGLETSYMKLDPELLTQTKQTVGVVNLFEKSNIQSIIENFVKTFIYFAPVGLVILMILGVGLAEQVGFFSATIRLLIKNTPRFLITYVVALTSICANIASDAGIVIAPALGAAIFLAVGRHPIAGVCTGYVAAYGGYSANIFVAGTDVVLAGITESAIRFLDADIAVHPLMNWYVMMGSTIILASIVTLITEKVIIPYIGTYDPPDEFSYENEHDPLHVDAREKRGLILAGIATFIFLAILLSMIIPEDGLLRNPEGQILPKSPLISGIIFILFTYFICIGAAFGYGSGRIKSAKQIPRMMANGLSSVAGFLVVCIPASLFIDLFHRSNLTTIIAIEGANIFQEVQIGIIPALLLFSVMCALLNLFITSGFTQWMVTAPIFVPLFFQLGLSPAITQMAFRIGDSTTNIISPISAYLPMLLGLLERYRNRDQEIGIGSALSLMLPYSLALFIFWIIYFAIWLMLGLDPGPGVSMFVE